MLFDAGVGTVLKSLQRFRLDISNPCFARVVVHMIFDAGVGTVLKSLQRWKFYFFILLVSVWKDCVVVVVFRIPIFTKEWSTVKLPAALLI